MAELRVLVVDDEPLVREGIRAFLEREADVRVLGEARNGEEALSRIAQQEQTIEREDRPIESFG